jgi:hypothetical protein
MPGFTKLFSEIITSSIWSEDDKTRIVWITMLASCDAMGVVRASVPGLAHVAHVNIVDTRKALLTLCKPDPDSRSKEFEGRRIKECDGGWVILNYTKYRNARHEDERKAYMASYMREYRAKQRVNTSVSNSKQCKPQLTTVNPGKPQLAQAEAEAEADIIPPIPPKGGSGTVLKFEEKFIEFWNLLPKPNRIGCGKAKEAWNKKIKSGSTPDEIIEGVPKLARSERLRKDQDPNGYRPIHAATWINQERWNDGEEFI